MTDEKKGQSTDTTTVGEEDDFVFGEKKETDTSGSDNDGSAGKGGEELSDTEKEKTAGDNTGEKGTKETKDKGAVDSEKGDGKKAEDSSKGTESKTEDGSGSGKSKEDRKTGDEKGEDTGKSKDGSDNGEGAKKKSDGEDVDFFGDEFKDDAGTGKKETFDVKGFASEFDIETEDPVELKQKINEKIENAKQEVKLDGFSPEAQGIIKHLNKNGGKIEDIFQNKSIASLQSVIGLNPEQKVLYVRHNELMKAGMSSDEATEKAEGEIEKLGTRELKDQAAMIDENAGKLITKEVEQIIGDRNELVEKQNKKLETKTKQEVANLKSFINAQENFMGIELTPKAKKSIVRDIETGVFDKVANKNPVNSKFSAYMLAKFGSKILENYSNNASEQNRKGHNEAVDKSLGALHNSKESASNKGAGKQSDSSGTGKNFESWQGDEMFTDET